MNAVSLFTGVGGLDFGFEAAGFKTRVAVESHPVCCKVIRRNRRWAVIEDDLQQVSGEALLEKAQISPGEVDLLLGGPPCQPWSKAAYWREGGMGGMGDPRSATLHAYLRVLEELRPKAFVLENVPGLVFREKEGLSVLERGVREVNRRAQTGYRLCWGTLRAVEFGVPQHRDRVFVVGSRDGKPFDFPEPTHGAPEDDQVRSGALMPYCTAWDAIGDLDTDDVDAGLEVGGKWGALLPSIPEGQNYLWHTPRGGGKPIFGWRTRFWSFLLKLSKKKPGWTIQARPGNGTGPFHWKNRRLSVDEMCRLQTLPESVRVDCARTEAQRMLGNAVPSLLAETIAIELKRQLFAGRRSLEDRVLVPERRTPVPRAERRRAVPAEYDGFFGEHPDHPGTGLGPAGEITRSNLSSAGRAG